MSGLVVFVRMDDTSGDPILVIGPFSSIEKAWEHLGDLSEKERMLYKPVEIVPNHPRRPRR